MNTPRPEGFFPEREVLSARRARVAVSPPKNNDSRTGRTCTWVVLMAVFVPLGVNLLTQGWKGHLTPRSLTLLITALSLLLVGCAAVVTVALLRSLRRSRSG